MLGRQQYTSNLSRLLWIRCVQAYLSVSKYVESSFNHCGGLVKLVQSGLSVIQMRVMDKYLMQIHKVLIQILHTKRHCNHSE